MGGEKRNERRVKEEEERREGRVEKRRGRR